MAPSCDPEISCRRCIMKMWGLIMTSKDSSSIIRSHKAIRMRMRLASLSVLERALGLSQLKETYMKNLQKPSSSLWLHLLSLEYSQVRALLTRTYFLKICDTPGFHASRPELMKSYKGYLFPPYKAFKGPKIQCKTWSQCTKKTLQGLVRHYKAIQGLMQRCKAV